MKQVADEALPGTAVIHSATFTNDGQGGQTAAFAASGTVDARLAPLTGNERELASRIAEVSTHILTVPASTTVDERSRVIYESVTYEVTGVFTNTPWEISRRVALARID